MNQISGFLQAIRALGQEDLAALHAREVANAPHRHAADKSYLVGHDGIPGKGEETNRREEPLAIALFNEYQPGKSLPSLPGGESLSILDYQFPLKARQADEKVGKVDLLGISRSRGPMGNRSQGRGRQGHAAQGAARSVRLLGDRSCEPRRHLPRD